MFRANSPVSVLTHDPIAADRSCVPAPVSVSARAAALDHCPDIQVDGIWPIETSPSVWLIVHPTARASQVCSAGHHADCDTQTSSPASETAMVSCPSVFPRPDRASTQGETLDHRRAGCTDGPTYSKPGESAQCLAPLEGCDPGEPFNNSITRMRRAHGCRFSPLANQPLTRHYGSSGCV